MTLSRKHILWDVVLAGTMFAGMVTYQGCRAVTAPVGSTAQAPTFYSQAAKVMADYSSILLSAQNLFTTAHTEALVTDTQYQDGQKVFLLAAQDGQIIDSLIQSGASASTIIAQVNALSATIASMPQAFAIKNPQTQAEFTALTGSLTTLLDTVATLTQNPTGAVK